MVHDRKYFLSLYVRNPAGILLEYATDGPGMTVDEAADELGRTSFLPPREAGRAEDLKAMLPNSPCRAKRGSRFATCPFIQRFNRPDDPDGTTVILLHGTGGSDADLMPIGRRIAPRATLLGVRGRATEEGTNRWFRRLDATTFDQADIRSEAEAFAACVDGAVTGYGLDAERLIFLGYSNGANFLAAVLQLHAGLVRNAVLLRGMQVLATLLEGDLSETRVLLLSGRDDPFAPDRSEFADNLRARGALVDVETLSAGHELAAGGVAEAARWIG